MLYIPTVQGVIVLEAMSGKGFGAPDLAHGAYGDDGELLGIFLEPCEFTAEETNDDVYQVVDVSLPKGTMLALFNQTWKQIEELQPGDVVCMWEAETGSLTGHALDAAPVLATGPGIRIRAGKTGVIFGASAVGPWLLGR